jgi:ribosomal peptide maturation radical SAM protein 1
MKLVLVTMPWHAFEIPSAAIGVLHATVNQQVPDVEVVDIYGSLEWVDFLAASGCPFGAEHYKVLSDEGYLYSAGDWIFTSALYGRDTYREDEYITFLNGDLVDPGLLRAAHRLAPAFIEKLANEVCAMRPEMVGFTTSFQQNISSLALATAIKRIDSSILTVMGGSNCDGVQGPALHRAFDVLDFVVSGEGEPGLLQLLDATRGNRELSEVAGLSWRTADGTTRTNAPASDLVEMDSVPTPNYHNYFARLMKSPYSSSVDRAVVLETARGCWWGELRHCTFCGINGSTIKFRSKSPEAAMAMIEEVVERYDVRAMYMVDNILDRRYLTTLLPEIAERQLGLTMHYEIKSNISYRELEVLQRAGVVHVQPGIESLSSRLLQVMRKGVDAIQNVRMLRDCGDLGLDVAWNYLFGFIGETPDDYEPIIEQMDRLWHLQPPAGCERLVLERFSPNFDNPDLGYIFRRPAPAYDYLYEVPYRLLRDIAYAFATPVQGISGDAERSLKEAVQLWRDNHRHTVLRLDVRRDGTARVERGVGEDMAEDLSIRHTAVAVELGAGLGYESLQRRLFRSGLSLGDGELEAAVESLDARGMLFRESDRFLTIASGTGRALAARADGRVEDEVDFRLAATP